MNKTYTFLCAVLGILAIALTDNKASLTDEDLVKIDNALKEKDDVIASKDATIANLQAKLDKKPAEDTSAVVDDAKQSGKEATKNDVEQFVDTYNSARAFYNEV